MHAVCLKDSLMVVINQKEVRILFVGFARLRSCFHIYIFFSEKDVCFCYYPSSHNHGSVKNGGICYPLKVEYVIVDERLSGETKCPK